MDQYLEESQNQVFSEAKVPKPKKKAGVIDFQLDGQMNAPEAFIDDRSLKGALKKFGINLYAIWDDEFDSSQLSFQKFHYLRQI